MKRDLLEHPIQTMTKYINLNDNIHITPCVVEFYHIIGEIMRYVHSEIIYIKLKMTFCWFHLRSRPLSPLDLSLDNPMRSTLQTPQVHSIETDHLQGHLQ